MSFLRDTILGELLYQSSRQQFLKHLDEKYPPFKASRSLARWRTTVPPEAGSQHGDPVDFATEINRSNDVPYIEWKGTDIQLVTYAENDDPDAWLPDPNSKRAELTVFLPGSSELVIY